MERDIRPRQYREGDQRTNVELITNHAKVLCCLMGNPTATGSKIARELGLAPRTITQIIKELKETGIIKVERIKGPGNRGRGGSTLYNVDPRTVFPSIGIGNLELGKFFDCINQIK